MLHRIQLASCILLLAGLGGCVDPDPALDTTTEAIRNGDPKHPQSAAVGLARDAAGAKLCSVTMIGNDVGLTIAPCAPQIHTVDIAGNTTGVRVLRVLRHTNEDDEKDIAVVQLRKPLPLANGRGVSTKGYVRDAIPQPLAVGDIVLCFGYASGKLASGYFMVADNSSDQKYYLEGLNALSGAGLYEVGGFDAGGYCERDGGGIVAILLGATDPYGVAPAAPVHDLVSSIVDMRYAAQAADQGVAVLLRDHDQQRLLEARVGQPSVHATTALADQRSQAYYLDEVTNPPGGGFDWYRLVDVRSGRCLTADPASKQLYQRSCDPALREQIYYLDYTQIGGLGRYILRASGGTVVDADANGLPGDLASLAPDDRGGSQRFEMWLTRW